MNCIRSLASFCLAVVLPLTAAAQVKSPEPGSQNQKVIVPVSVAALVRPILDEEAKPSPHDQSRLSNLLYDLTKTKDAVADQALVVLMCFYVGESEEEVDEVIARGKRMLPLLKKYRDRNPVIPGRSYPNTMLRGVGSKDEAFQGAVKAIRHGWHSTSDNPEGQL